MDGSQASGAHQTLHRHDNVRKPRLTCRRYRRASSRHSVRATARRLPLEREAQAESDEHEARQSVTRRWMRGLVIIRTTQSDASTMTAK